MARVLPKFPSRRLSAKRRVARTEPALGLRFLGLQPRFEPKELLEFEFRIQRVALEEVDRLEISVMWYTEGKGTEDFGVHLFQSLSGEEIAPVIDGRSHPIVTTLPASPLSYEGRLLNIRWCVRLRLYLNDGREISAEKPFYLGNLTVEV